MASMVSICIPIFNVRIGPLVSGLWRSASVCGVEFEILAADDCSEENIELENREYFQKQAGEHPQLRYLENKEKMGRSRIRNFLVSKAKYGLILMLDCDAALPDEDFVGRYLEHLSEADVWVGGCAYRIEAPDDGKRLRWEYGRQREALPAAIRNRQTWKSFSSFNAMYRRQVLLSCPYDENIQGYGHEDTLLGLALEAKGFRILHLDNPLYHEGLDKNAQYLSHSRLAVEKFITNPAFSSDKVIQNIRILHCYERLKALHLDAATACVYRHFGSAMEKQLCGSQPSVHLFDLYRLSYLCHYGKCHSASSETASGGTGSVDVPEGNPLISVIVPTYNRADVLDRCMESVFRQTYRPIELIVVDNGSTDHTQKVFESLQKRFESDEFPMKWEKEEQRGACQARNRGHKASSGRFICFFDSDDEMHPEMLSTLFAAFSDRRQSENGIKTPDFTAGFGRIDRSSKKHPKSRSDNPARQLIDPVLITHNILASRTYLDRVGLWNPTLERWQDLEFGFRLLLPHPHCAWTSGPLFTIHPSQDAISAPSFSADETKLAHTLNVIHKEILSADEPDNERVRQLVALSFKITMTAATFYREKEHALAERWRNWAETLLPDRRNGRKKGHLLIQFAYIYAKYGGRGCWRVVRWFI